MRYLYDRPVVRSTPHFSHQDRQVQPALYTNREFAARTIQSIKNHTVDRSKICLIISAYNEERVLKHTIESAISAGLSRADIYVVDDASDDKTAAIAHKVVGKYNLLTVDRSGKGRAISTIVKELQLIERYEWIHIADADGEFDKRYFQELYDNLDPAYAAATGYMASLPGGYVGNFRNFEYTMAMDVARRYQSILDLITVIPGPTSVFRSDVFRQLDFCTGALCEDFDVTLQIHDRKLGKIKFIETAIARTQDPHDMQNYLKQITRWNRGTLQLFVRNKMWRKVTRVNSFITYQVMQNIMFAAMYGIGLPILTVLTGSLYFIAVTFCIDVLTIFGFALYTAMRTKRFETLTSFPLTYFLRWAQLFVFVKCFFEVVVMKRYRISHGSWETVVRLEQQS
jgi:biofilm PGA synthesis N-glycosyltransferase PgaC